MPATCFSYSGNTPPGQRGGTNSACFSYSPDVPPEAANLDAAQPTLPDLRRMPSGACFRY
jgi:hypothetical protein